MPSGTARQNILRLHAARAGYSCGVALCLFLFGSKALQNAVAEGETRTITMHHAHTGEDITITYKREGRYDEAALQKLNWFLRDWRRGEATRMDPQLIDLLWEVQRETGSKQPIDVICGYRSPQTNAMLRRRSRGVARFSQHMLGHAMDFYIPGVPLEELRVLGLRLQRGGVGFYPTSGSPFVHMDTGGVRMWPRMSRNELLRVFPDGRTAYIPSDGQPLAGYELALADIRKRGQNISPVVLADTTAGNPLAKLFGFVKPAQQQPEPEEDAEIETASIAAPSGAPAHYFPSSSGPAQIIAPAQQVAAAAVPAPPVTPAPAADAKKPQNPLLAALEREAARKRATIELGAAVRPPAAPAPPATANASAQQPATYQLASYEQTPVGQAPQRLAALTPNQVITARGYWAGLPDGEAAAQPAQSKTPVRAAHPTRKEVVAPAAHASVASAAAAESPWAPAHEDRVPPELALAYAAPPEGEGAAAPSPVASVTRAAIVPRNAAPVQLAAHLPAPPPATTIAVKRTATQSVSTILAAPTGGTADENGARFNSPWLRAVILSPSVRRYLITLLLGDTDYRALAALIDKPASSVMMTFAAEPNPGLTADRFSGNAVVFLSTVTYGTHTAALQ